MSLLFHIYDDETGEKHDCELKCEDTPHACLNIQGFGDHCSDDDDGHPIMLNMQDGELKLYVWADINQEDPTHIISLEGARVEKREETS